VVLEALVPLGGCSGKKIVDAGNSEGVLAQFIFKRCHSQKWKGLEGIKEEGIKAEAF
jgi:hypothetical protein